MDDIQLSKDQIAQLKMGFDAFDPDKKGTITTDTVGTILGMMGMRIPSDQLLGTIAEYDPFGSGEINFEEFCSLASRFMEEDTDTEAMQQELREAFRLDILHELDDALSPEELDMIIDEVDADGSGTVDFEEFMEVMTG
ncbi:Troponin C, isoallergen Bla g 6.0201 [Anthophora quadrimaculata]